MKPNALCANPIGIIESQSKSAIVSFNGAYVTERLWTPWRMTYVGGNARQPGCVFCNALGNPDDAESFVLLRRATCFLILNRYPYNSGHSMIVPNAHAASLEDLDSTTRAEMFELATLAVEASRAILKCAGFNLGLNLGEIAGAGIAQHLHLHVVPRWTGDANFMPILADTVVLPELLPVTYARLRAELERLVATREHDAVPQAKALVVLRDSASVVLLRDRAGDIDLPGGPIEALETSADAAIRHVREKAGVIAVLEGWAGSHSFEYADVLHHVSFLLATGAASIDVEQHGDSDSLIIPIEDAANVVTVPAVSEMIRANLPHLRRLAGDRS